MAVVNGSVRGPRGGRWLWAALACLLLAFSGRAPAADTPTRLTEQPGTMRVLSHVPDAPQPPLDASAQYLAAVKEASKKYQDFYTNAQISEALAEARNGLTLAEEANRPRDEAEFLKGALYAAWLLGESVAGLDYGQRLIARADSFNDDRMRSLAHRVIGSIFRQLNQRDQQREHTQLALQFAERAGDAPLRIAALNNLGNMAMDDGDLATARKIHEEVLAYREKNNLRWDAAGTLTNLAEVAERAHDLPQALSLHERGLKIRLELDDKRGVVRSLCQVAGILRQLNRTDEALVRLNDAQSRAEKIGGHDLLNLVYSELAKVHEARKEFQEALSAERVAAREREALAGETARTRAAEVEARFDLARKQQMITALSLDKKNQATELSLREAELDRARWQRYGLIAFGLFCVAVIGLVVIKLRADRRILDEARTAREAAEAADRVKTRFLGIASHDIRAPLANILNLAGLLRSTPRGAIPRTDHIELIAAEAQRVLTLVQDLTATAALESGKLELRTALIDLAEVVEATLDTLRWQASAKGQMLSFVPPAAGVGLVKADATRLHQVISNLVGNAIKFSPQGKEITLALTRDTTTVRLAVRDQGPGISSSDATRLFTPFERLSSHPTAGESSHGLGLSIASELIRLHGGRIHVESQPGQGATFIVELPAAS